ncbi:alpha-amylase family protein [Actinomycetaceae bacterium L2_0104]
MSLLLDHAIWWQIFPLGALNAPIRDRHGDDAAQRLQHPEPWLDYIQQLGCNGVLLGPIFTSVSHGYDTLDHFSIDPRLGNDADFDYFVEICHERGIHIMLDGVFNHVAETHPRAAEFTERDEHGNLQTWEGHGGLVNLDHSNPAVADLVTEVMLYWLRRGISGWRLDVAYDVPPEFWREVTGRVRQEFPGALFLGEMIHGEYEKFVEESTLDTITQYRLWKAIWSSIKEVNCWELDWGIKEHAGLCEHYVPQTFIGNHDVERIATRVGIDGAAVAAGVLLTLPGMPSIYYGDEQGFQGRKLEGFAADDELRPPLPPSPDELFPAGNWLYNLYQDLIGVRRRHPWIGRGLVEVTGKDNPWIEYTVSNRGGDESIHVRATLEPTKSLTIADGDGNQLLFWEEAGEQEGTAQDAQDAQNAEQ